MKGLDPVISHVTMSMVGIVAVSMILIVIFNFTSDIRESSLEAQLDYVADITKTEILKLYSIGKESQLAAEIKLSLPEKISNNVYTIELYQDGLKVIMDGMEVNRTVNIPISMSGSSSPPIFLKYQLNSIVIE